MFDFRLMVRLLAGTFVLRKGHIRYPTPKRVISALVFLPLYAILLVYNWLFLWLDEILFPQYRHQLVKKAVFISAIPRSATTMLFHQLAHDEKNFSCFKMWELVLAPAICQKYFFLALRWVDARIGNPLYRISLKLDDLIFGSFRGIHDMGLTKPEEDEALFLLLFVSNYLTFFFTDHPAYEPYLLFDTRIPEARRRKIMVFYRRGIQRHNYVFNRREERYFLSKNPTFVPKLVSLYEQFPDARLLYPLRSPLQTIPATISLNAHLYAAFSPFILDQSLHERTRDRLLDWYAMGENALQNYWRDQALVLAFSELKKQPAQKLAEIYSWLELEITPAHREYWSEMAQKAQNFQSQHQYDKNAGVDEALIRERLPFMFEAPYAKISGS